MAVAEALGWKLIWKDKRAVNDPTRQRYELHRPDGTAYGSNNTMNTKHITEQIEKLSPEQQQYVEALIAKFRGKPIQEKLIGSDNPWHDVCGITHGPHLAYYRLKPWTLGRSVNGFTLGEGQQWHREDWTEEMLPHGCRPLTKSEFDDMRHYDLERKSQYSDWKGGVWNAEKSEIATCFFRTRRPLPPAEWQAEKEAFKRGEVVQFADANSDGQWSAWRDAPEDFLFTSDGGYRKWRVKPVERWVPWEFKTRPKELIWVWKKGYISDRMITAWKDDSVEIGSYATISYIDLFLHWQQRDGTPCGRLA